MSFRKFPEEHKCVFYTVEASKGQIIMWQKRALEIICVSEINRAIGNGESLTLEQMQKLVTLPDEQKELPPANEQPHPEEQEEPNILPHQNLVVQRPGTETVVVNERTIGAVILECFRNELFKVVRVQLEKTSTSQVTLEKNDEMRFLRAIDGDVRKIILCLCSYLPSQTSAIIALRKEAIDAIEATIPFTEHIEKAYFLDVILLFRTEKLQKRKQAMRRSKGSDDFGF